MLNCLQVVLTANRSSALSHYGKLHEQSGLHETALLVLASNSTALGSVLVTSNYYDLVCYQTHEEQIIRNNVLTVEWFHSHDFQEYFKSFASPWRHFPASHGNFSF